MNSVAIIGSFQKYYDKILEIIKCFKQSGWVVLSPKESFITRSVENFVIFDSDKKEFTPAEIQMVTLEKILAADIVYVFNPNGYVGRTTCYEIGFCLSRKRPIYYSAYPVDLPIPVSECQVMTPEAITNNYDNKNAHFIEEYGLAGEARNAFNNIFNISENKRIVICGSMSFYSGMAKCQESLEAMGINSIIPKDESIVVESVNSQQLLNFKRKVSSAYLRKIREKETVGVLIYNAEKHGTENYIGANTLVEIAMAFAWNRKIYLLNDIYGPLADELNAWGCVSLNGNLSIIKNDFQNKMFNAKQYPFEQMSLF